MGNPRITAESLGDCTVSCRFRLKAHDDLDVQPFTGPSEDEGLQSDQLIEVLMIKIYEDLHKHTSEKSYPKRVLATAQVAQGKMHGEGLLRYSNGHLDSTQKLRWIILQDLPTKSNQYTEFIIDWNSSQCMCIFFNSCWIWRKAHGRPPAATDPSRSLKNVSPATGHSIVSYSLQ
jgi:hypothetical protein